MFFASEPKISKHARQRMHERRIQEWELVTVLERGEYTVRDEDIRVQIKGGDRRLLGLVVVLSSDEQVVLTAFWRKKECDRHEMYRHFTGPSPVFSLGDQLRGQVGEFNRSKGEK